MTYVQTQPHSKTVGIKKFNKIAEYKMNIQKSVVFLSRPRREARGWDGQWLASRQTAQPLLRSDYKLFNCSNFNIRYWSWNYRGCWYQTYPPVGPRGRQRKFLRGRVVLSHWSVVFWRPLCLIWRWELAG